MKGAILILGVLFIGLFVFGFIYYFEDHPTAGAALVTAQIQTAVSALFTQNAPTSSTVSTETATPNEQSNEEELAYVNRIEEELKAYDQILDDISAKHHEVTENPVLMFVDTWRDEISLLFENLQTHARNFSEYSPVPQRFSAVNDVLDRIYAETLQLVFNYNQGLYNDDAEAFNASAVNIQNINDLFGELNDALATLLNQR